MLLSPIMILFLYAFCFKEIHPTVPNVSKSLISSLLSGAVIVFILGRLVPFDLCLAPDGRTCKAAEAARQAGTSSGGKFDCKTHAAFNHAGPSSVGKVGCRAAAAASHAGPYSGGKVGCRAAAASTSAGPSCTSIP